LTNLEKLAWVTKSWTTLGMPTLVALPSGVFAPHIRDFPYHLGCILTFFWFLQLATAYIPKRIFTKNKPKDVVLAKDVPSVGRDDHNYYDYYVNSQIFKKPPFWGPILTGLDFLRSKIALTWRLSNI